MQSLIKSNTAEVTKAFQIGLDQDFLEKRDNLLMITSGIQDVTAHNVDEYARQARDIKGLLGMVEDSRKIEKAPLLKACKMLDDIADQAKSPLKAELDRIEPFFTEFRQQQERLAMEQERSRQAQIEKAESERQEAIKAAQIACNGDPDSLESATAAQFAAIAAEEAGSKADALLRSPLPSAIKAKGASLRTKLEWEITDEKALFSARPELFLPPMPNKLAITAMVGAGQVLPGVRVWETVKTTFKR